MTSARSARSAALPARQTRPRHPDRLRRVQFDSGRNAKRAGVRVLYYITPQVWAWRRGRIDKMVDRSTGWPWSCRLKRSSPSGRRARSFVGHPLLDRVAVAQGREETSRGMDSPGCANARDPAGQPPRRGALSAEPMVGPRESSPTTTICRSDRARADVDRRGGIVRRRTRRAGKESASSKTTPTALWLPASWRWSRRAPQRWRRRCPGMPRSNRLQSVAANLYSGADARDWG